MSKIMVENKADIPDDLALKMVKAVVAIGRICDGRRYQCKTKFRPFPENLFRIFTVHFSENSQWDRFVILEE